MQPSLVAFPTKNVGDIHWQNFLLPEASQSATNSGTRVHFQTPNHAKFPRTWPHDVREKALQFFYTL